jgi:hypothetical protein
MWIKSTEEAAAHKSPSLGQSCAVEIQARAKQVGGKAPGNIDIDSAKFV